jgi:tRNA(Arg) A34 adenosine deaminase TadA
MKKNILRDCLRIAREKNDLHPEWGNFMHYAFIIQGNKIIEMGMNRPVSGDYRKMLKCMGYRDDTKLHAEIDAYFKAKGHPDFDFSKKFECVNIRLNKIGQIKNSSPCSICARNLLLFGCKDVYFTDDEGFKRTKVGTKHAEAA